MEDLFFLPAHQLHDLYAQRAITASEVVERFYERIEALEPKVKAYLLLTKELACKQASEVDKKLKEGKPLSPLEGIPIAIKDNLCLRGYETTCASNILKGFISPYDATVIERLRREGMIFLGKTNMDEFAMGSSTENSAFKVTGNPWDLERIPGGSSGGSAAAVSASLATMALGSDTGGSIRQPAALCGVVGLKPTYSRVSRYGLVAFASSLDQIGPITKDVRDCALLSQAICGFDPRDSTSSDKAVEDFPSLLREDLKGLRLGVPREYFAQGLDEEVAKKIEEALALLKELGAETVEVSMPHTPYAVADYYIICTAEASSNLARYDGVKYGFRDPEAKELLEMYELTKSRGFGPEVKRRIMLGTYVLSSGYYEAYYLKAQKVRTLIRQDFFDAFQKGCHALVTPTSPSCAFKVGEKMDDPLKMYLSDIYTISANLAGLPGLSIPCALSREGLPIGLQLLGRPFDEATLLSMAHAFEKRSGLQNLRPPLFGGSAPKPPLGEPCFPQTP